MASGSTTVPIASLTIYYSVSTNYKPVLTEDPCPVHYLIWDQATTVNFNLCLKSDHRKLVLKGPVRSRFFNHILIDRQPDQSQNSSESKNQDRRLKKTVKTSPDQKQKKPVKTGQDRQNSDILCRNELQPNMLPKF